MKQQHTLLCLGQLDNFILLLSVKILSKDPGSKNESHRSFEDEYFSNRIFQN